MENEHIELRKKVEEKLGFKPTVRRHFDQLADAVFEVTKEQISSTTLRRIWGYQETDRPTAVRRYTLDLLSRYAGYKDYDDLLSDIQEPVQEEKPIKKGKSKRTILVACIITAVALICAATYLMMPQPHHYDFEYKGLYYKILPGSNNCVEVTYNSIEPSYKVLDIAIPETVQNSGKTYKVTAIGDSAFAFEHGLIAIVLPPTIERIGAEAFLNCDSLSYLNMPDAVVSIGEYAMRCCEVLISVRLSENITEIPSHCFSHCINLQEIKIPQGIKALRYDAFGDCFKLRQIELPEGLESIERGAFWNCRSLTEITLPSSLKSIGDFVFWGCDTLQTITSLPTSPIRITNIFKKLNSNLLLNVPEGSVDSYSNAQYWNKLRISPITQD